MVIRENESADTAAKAGLDEPIANMKFPVNNLLTCVNRLRIGPTRFMNSYLLVIRTPLTIKTISIFYSCRTSNFFNRVNRAINYFNRALTR